MNVSCNCLLAMNTDKILLHNWRSVHQRRSKSSKLNSTQLNNVQSAPQTWMEMKHRSPRCDMYRKRGQTSGTFISNPLCSADLVPDHWASIFYSAVETQTRTFIVRDQLTSSEEQQLFWAHETEAQRLGHGRKRWPLNERGLAPPLFGPAWLAEVARSEWYPYRGSPLQSVGHVRLSSDVIGVWRRRSGAGRTIALIRAPCAHTCARSQTESLCRYSLLCGCNIMKCLR